MTTYRAAYWIAEDSQADVVLTGEEHQHLSDDELMALAIREAAEIGLEIGDGEIVIGDYTT